MKAKINGLEVEGTPEEVFAFVKIMDDARRDGVNIKPPLGKMPEWLKKDVYIGGGSVTWQPDTKSCSNQLCYCTGACKS